MTSNTKITIPSDSQYDEIRLETFNSNRNIFFLSQKGDKPDSEDVLLLSKKQIVEMIQALEIMINQPTVDLCDNG